MYRIIPLFVNILLASQSLADCSGNSCTQVKINRFVVTANGDLSINTDGAESQLNCDVDSYGYLKLRKSSTNYEATYSLLLALKMTDSVVDRIRVNDAGECDILYIIHD